MQKDALSMQLHGIDFTSAPSKRKGITIASGVLDGNAYRLQSLTTLHDYTAFTAWLQKSGPWLGAFDFPFSLPRELVEYLGWPTDWISLMHYVASLSRAELREIFKAFCDARPVGNKFAHRATDWPAGSSSPMKWVNPPVAYMLHAGVPLLLEAGVTIYSLHPGDPSRIALEGYPGMVARSITKASYKSDERAKQTPARHDARVHIVECVESGTYPLGIRLISGEFRDALIHDATGDLLDAVLCGLLAAWAWQRRHERYGLPEFDILEGWIVGA
jgi:hypothetical protein